MPRRVIVTINPIMNGKPSKPAAVSTDASVRGTAVKTEAAELLMLPKPFRLAANAMAGISPEKR